MAMGSMCLVDVVSFVFLSRVLFAYIEASRGSYRPVTQRLSHNCPVSLPRRNCAGSGNLDVCKIDLHLVLGDDTARAGSQNPSAFSLAYVTHEDTVSPLPTSP